MQLKAKTAEFRARLGRGETLADVQAGTAAVIVQCCIATRFPFSGRLMHWCLLLSRGVCRGERSGEKDAGDAAFRCSGIRHCLVRVWMECTSWLGDD